MGNGNGGFSAAITDSTGKCPVFFANGDFNGDGNMDIVTTNQGLNSLAVYQGNGNGSFTIPVSFGLAYDLHYIISADFNNDGYGDIAVSNSGKHEIIILLNTSPITGIKTLTGSKKCLYIPIQQKIIFL